MRFKIPAGRLRCLDGDAFARFQKLLLRLSVAVFKVGATESPFFGLERALPQPAKESIAVAEISPIIVNFLKPIVCQFLSVTFPFYQSLPQSVPPESQES